MKLFGWMYHCLKSSKVYDPNLTHKGEHNIEHVNVLITNERLTDVSNTSEYINNYSESGNSVMSELSTIDE